MPLRNNGHSSFKNTVDFAGRHGIKRLVLFHHDSQYSDEDLDRIAGEAARLVSEKSYSLCRAAVNLWLWAGTTRSSWSPVMTMIAG